MPNADLTNIQNPERLELLRQLGLLDPSTDAAFDRLTRLATMILKMPTSLVSLVETTRQFFKSSVGLPEPWATLREMPLDYSFCQHVVATGEPLIIEDATHHPLVMDNPAVKELDAISYAGMPLTLSNGIILGSFCVVDSRPHTWTDEELTMLADLAGAVMTEIELRGQLIERERIENELREKEMRLNAVISSAPVVLYTMDMEGIITLSQGKALSSAGIKQNEVVGQSAFERNANHPAILETLHRAITGEAFSVVLESRQRWYSLSYSPLLDKTGNLEGSICVATDVTEMMRTQQALELALQRLGDLERLKSEMIRVAAHDLKNPLSGIMGYTQLLMETGLDDNQKDLAKEVVQNARRMVRIINDILSLERIEMMADSAKYQKVDLRALTARAYSENEAAAFRKNQVYQFSPPDDAVYVSGDEGQLFEAASNLISNAVKYTPDGGKITVCLRAEDQQKIVFEVQDNGCGIPEDFQQNLFKPFFRAKTKETREIEGTGLGLNIVKNIVERHVGTMRFKSEYGVGSTFGFELNRLC